MRYVTVVLLVISVGGRSGLSMGRTAVDSRYIWYGMVWYVYRPREWGGEGASSRTCMSGLSSPLLRNKPLPQAGRAARADSCDQWRIVLLFRPTSPCNVIKRIKPSIFRETRLNLIRNILSPKREWVQSKGSKGAVLISSPGMVSKTMASVVQSTA